MYWRRLIAVVGVAVFSLSLGITANAAESLLRDPTDPSGNGGSTLQVVVGDEAPKGQPKLRTIIKGSATSIAIVNGKRVRVNDRVGGFVVKEIRRKEVVLEKAGEELFLFLPNHSPKTREKKSSVSQGVASHSGQDM